MNKFKVERKTLEAAQLRRVRNRIQESIAKMDPSSWQRFVDRLDSEKVAETFIFGGNSTTSTVETDEWTGPGYWATVDDVSPLDLESFTLLASQSDWLPIPTVTSNGDGTYTHTFQLGATVV